MYKKIVFNIIIGKIDTYINFKVGVKQRYSMDPVIFMLLMMAFAETIEYE